MTSSTLDLVPRAQSARGTGSNAATGWTPPASYTSTTGQALIRASSPDYFAWLSHVQAAAGCTRPIRLSGTLDKVEARTGRLLDSRHTDELPDSAIYKACGNRRATVCPSCARTYQRDAYQIVRTGLIGGKGVPATVARHPAVFATLTAPSFGVVHTRRVRKHTCRDVKSCDCRPDPCHARRDTGLCEHERPAVCWARHDRDDAQLGQPLCLDCYDHNHHVVWNLFSGELWHRTKQDAERRLFKLCRARKVPFVEVFTATGRVRRVPPVRLAHGKVAEMQRRGAIHFHALLRLDGVHPFDSAAVVPPPASITVDDLVDALSAAATATAFTSPTHHAHAEGWPIGWGDPGKGLDVRPITMSGTGDITDSKVAGYLAKYATKSTEATGHTSTRITDDTVGLYAHGEGTHVERLIDACWRLGHEPGRLSPHHGEGLRAHRGYTGTPHSPFGEPWNCPDCGTHTRYHACPVCAAERQGSLDTKPASVGTAVNPYARLRRWAHMLGYGGHFLTKARRYSVTFRLLRDTRIVYRRAETQAEPDPSTVRAVEHLDETTLTVGTFSFAGVGWHNNGDALLANTAAAMARARREAGREELAHEAGSVAPLVLHVA